MADVGGHVGDPLAGDLEAVRASLPDRSHERPDVPRAGPGSTSNRRAAAPGAGPAAAAYHRGMKVSNRTVAVVSIVIVAVLILAPLLEVVSTIKF
jgi:hypothetical protein